MEKCRLCGLERKLQRRSHVVPHFFYKNLDGKLGSLLQITTDALRTGTARNGHRMGEYCEFVLCRNCENDILNKNYENPARKYFYPIGQNLLMTNAKKLTTFDGLNVSLVSDIDYSTYKLFLLSILWRAGISDRPNHKVVQLGPHAEIIQQMILEGNAGDPEMYPIITFSFELNDGSVSELVGYFARAHIGNVNVYTIPISNLIFFIFINSNTHKLPEWVLKNNITTENILPVIHLNPSLSITFLRKYFDF